MISSTPRRVRLARCALAWIAVVLAGCAGRDAPRPVARVIAPSRPIDPDPDRDGVVGDRDRCPTVAEDRDGVADSDGCPEVDQDCDGIADALDRCPEEPEDVDRHQDDDGCVDRDNDGDTIRDGCDECPDEAEIVNNIDDEDGCPDRGPIVLLPDTVTIPPEIRFDQDSETLENHVMPIIAQIANALESQQSIRMVRIAGHATRDEEDPMGLSTARANGVRRALIERGVNQGRLVAVGEGTRRPLVPGNTPEARARNRRVDFTFVRLSLPSAPPAHDASVSALDAVESEPASDGDAAASRVCLFEPAYTPIAGGCPLRSRIQRESEAR